jgi:large subunit ribosomal protein L35
MPKNKSHKGLLKRAKITKSGRVRFRKPGSRHLKSNKSGNTTRSYRLPQYARAGDMKRLGILLFRPLKSQDQHEAQLREKERVEQKKSA